jgi:hypothetical protein
MYISEEVTAPTETAVEPFEFLLARNRATSSGLELAVEDDGRNVSINCLN